MATDKLPLNYMAKGMWPLNYASRLVKSSSDVMFHIGTCNKEQVLLMLEEVERAARELRALLTSTF